jgi:hypothetical protein
MVWEERDMLRKLGLGRGAEAKYQRAFEKGVLLGDYDGAIRMFLDTAKEFEKQGDLDGKNQALANARLYEYIHTGRPAALPRLAEHLRQLDDIECIGSATETMSAATLVAEVEARQAELAVEKLGLGTGHGALASAHEQARDKFEALLSEKLVTYSLVVKDEIGDGAQNRYYYHAGKACWHRAQAKVAVDPSAAAEEMSQSVLYYRRAGYQQGEQAANGALANLRLERTCWVCGREMQGQGINFDFLPTQLSQYHHDLVQRGNQDASSLDVGNSRVALCVVCKGLIAGLAQAIAGEIAAQKITQIEARIRKLSERTSKLERSSRS